MEFYIKLDETDIPVLISLSEDALYKDFPRGEFYSNLYTMVFT